MSELRGKVAVVTGGASGIGRALGARLLRAGLRVVLADVEAGALERTVEELRAAGGEVSGIQADVTRFESVQELERRVVTAHGGVHVLCNNAGVGAHEDLPLWELPLSDWRWTFAVNLWGVIHGIKAFVPGMLAHGEPGHVVNTSSGNGPLVVVPFTPAYSASKSAVSTITETLHLQLLQHQAKVQAHVLYPGPHVVTSNIFTAVRNRGAEFQRERPQVAPPVTLETLREYARASGREFATTTPEQVADAAFDGISAGKFFILPLSADGEAQVRERFENVLQRRNPRFAPMG